MIHLFLPDRRREFKWVYGMTGIGLLGGIIFYIYILFFDYAGHSMSAFLRSFQIVLFGGWTFITLIEKILETSGYKNLKHRILKYGDK